MTRKYVICTIDYDSVALFLFGLSPVSGNQRLQARIRIWFLIWWIVWIHLWSRVRPQKNLKMCHRNSELWIRIKTPWLRLTGFGSDLIKNPSNLIFSPPKFTFENICQNIINIYFLCLSWSINTLGASEVSANLYCNSHTSVLGRLRDYLRLLLKRSVNKITMPIKLI